MSTLRSPIDIDDTDFARAPQEDAERAWLVGVCNNRRSTSRRNAPDADLDSVNDLHRREGVGQGESTRHASRQPAAARFDHLVLPTLIAVL